jgi:photosystem II stability/assembly factor-like uncharacterized protein
MDARRALRGVASVVGAAAILVGCVWQTAHRPPGDDPGDQPATQSAAASPQGSALYTLSFVDAIHGWAGGSAGIRETGDGGRTWTLQHAGQDPILQVKSVDVNHAWALSAGGALLHTTDGGKQWAPLPSLPARFQAVDFTDPVNGWATDGTALFATADGGRTWDGIEAPGPVAAMAFLDSEQGWVTGGGSVWRTADRGRSWSEQLALPGAEAWRGRTWIQFSSEQDGWVLFTLGQGCASQEPYELWHTADGGQHWAVRMRGRGVCYPPVREERAPAPAGPGGYPVAFAAQGSTAWVVVNATAGGYLEIVQVSEEKPEPVSKGRLRMSAPRDGIMDLSVVGSGAAWLVTGDVPSEPGRVLHSSDGGATWE